MDFAHSEKVQDLQRRVAAFMEEHVYPAEARFHAEVEGNRARGNAWVPTRVVEELKKKARAAGLWNLWLPDSEYGAGLKNLEYAPLCEMMGRSHIGPEAFNCSAPDTGNMEVLVRYGNGEQKRQWLRPLLEGEIRSGFAMTEPAVASSDATNIEASIVRDGDHYVINGRKWWTSGAGDPRCRILIFTGKTDPQNREPSPAAVDDPRADGHAGDDRDIDRELGLELDRLDDSTTLGGLCVALARGRVPRAGERLEAGEQAELEIIDSSARRVRLVRVRPRAGCEAAGPG